MANEFLAAYYNRLSNDLDYRAELLADPKTVLCAEYGYPARDDFTVEVVDERVDTIEILLPAPPENGADLEQRLVEVTQRSYDLLFSSGVGGFLIPDDRLKWTLRDMRTTWMAKNDDRERDL
ncbi:hypothetical protein [Nocardia transvalensis]|uniref:hypothetical protein n=1 Tax=Nocardia transvalensis TaxID=37333 RepID=UPI00189558E3|nr:hypothetical protein [Nocardia transvalensis]MBF6332224.1 hypothetical protein [Nocardia transvalensis]